MISDALWHLSLSREGQYVENRFWTNCQILSSQLPVRNLPSPRILAEPHRTIRAALSIAFLISPPVRGWLSQESPRRGSDARAAQTTARSARRVTFHAEAQSFCHRREWIGRSSQVCFGISYNKPILITFLESI